MVITYHDKQFFKVQFGDTVLAFNPISKDSKLKGSRFGADIALVSMNEPDFNGIDQVAHGNKDPFVIAGPGEYEVNGIVIRGFMVDAQFEKEGKVNTIYTVELEGIHLCFLGNISTAELSDKTKEQLGFVDILFVPVGDKTTIGPSDARKLATRLEATLSIPMDYDEKTLQSFLRESGEEKVKPQDKLTLKRKDIDTFDSNVVVLKAQ